MLVGHVSTIIGGYVVGVGVVASVEEVTVHVSTIIGGYRVVDNVNLQFYSKRSIKVIFSDVLMLHMQLRCFWLRIMHICKLPSCLQILEVLAPAVFCCLHF